MWYVSGGRDEAAVEEPERFVVGRPKVRQRLSFGAGIHRCVGDWLLEITGPPVRLYSNFIRGIRALPVVISRLRW